MPVIAHFKFLYRRGPSFDYEEARTPTGFRIDYVPRLSDYVEMFGREWQVTSVKHHLDPTEDQEVTITLVVVK